MSADATLRRKFASVWGLLDERTRRLMAANEALSLGYGGLSRVNRACGLSRNAIARGIEEITAGSSPGVGRIRRAGAGRRPITARDPHLLAALDRVIDPDTRGDPESPLRWICKSTRTLAAQLTKQHHPISHVKLAALLHAQDYSLQSNRKTEEADDHPDRDAQFRHINAAVKQALRARSPVISVDTKKKELVGPYDNRGQQWRPAKQPVPVQGHDFPHPDVPRAYPYGIYDVGRNTGFVNVGTDHDTGAFAVASIRGWWRGERATLVSPHAPDSHHGGRRGQQRRAAAPLEMGTADVRGRDGPVPLRVPLSAGHQQMEQSRASPVLVHLLELARRALARL